MRQGRSAALRSGRRSRRSGGGPCERERYVEEIQTAICRPGGDLLSHILRSDEINTCIGCNQACLDHTFGGKLTSCLVNPRACHETELNFIPTTQVKNIAVVGAGPAGLAAATVAAERGHQVTLFDAAEQIGGQFNIAKLVPGKVLGLMHQSPNLIAM